MNIQASFQSRRGFINEELTEKLLAGEDIATDIDSCSSLTIFGANEAEIASMKDALKVAYTSQMSAFKSEVADKTKNGSFFLRFTRNIAVPASELIAALQRK